MGLLRLAQKTPEVSPATWVIEAVRLMTSYRVGAIAVTAGPRIVGIFTERDLMRRVVSDGRDPSATHIAEVMTTPVQTVPDAMSVSEAVSLMRQQHIRHLAIVDSTGDLRGIVAQRYLLYDLMDALERKVDDLHGYIMADGAGG